jgi:hypothetical protein
MRNRYPCLLQVVKVSESLNKSYHERIEQRGAVVLIVGADSENDWHLIISQPISFPTKCDKSYFPSHTSVTHCPHLSTPYATTTTTAFILLHILYLYPLFHNTKGTGQAPPPTKLGLTREEMEAFQEMQKDVLDMAQGGEDRGDRHACSQYILLCQQFLINCRRVVCPPCNRSDCC